MSDNLQNTDELLKELDKMAIRTSQGTFVKKEDVEALIRRREEANAIEEAEIPEKMNVHQARAKAKEFLGKNFGEDMPEPKLSIPARPSSRT